MQATGLKWRLGLPYLDLTDAIKSAVVREGKSHVFPDDYHFNAMAHKAAGEALARWVEGIVSKGKPATSQSSR